MDGVAIVVNEAARMNAQGSGGAANPAHVAQFEQLMQDAPAAANAASNTSHVAAPHQVDAPPPDLYIGRPDSPTEVLASHLLRAGSEASRNFRTQIDGMNAKLEALDPMSPASTQQLLEIQSDMMSASFQLSFTTSLVESATRGFSTLFHMQG
jgi:hypothetical protein